MKQFTENDSTEVRLSDAYYTEGALARSRWLDLLGDLVTVQDSLLASEQYLERLKRRPLLTAYAARDIAGMELGDIIRDVRHALGSGSRQAIYEAPYIEVFDSGVGMFVEVPIDEREKWVRRLITRIETYLAPDHPVRVAWVPVLWLHLDVWNAALAALLDVQDQVDLARKARDAARAAWDKVRVDVYGSLVKRAGKKGAERFFPKPAASKRPKVVVAAQATGSGAAVSTEQEAAALPTSPPTAEAK